MSFIWHSREYIKNYNGKNEFLKRGIAWNFKQLERTDKKQKKVRRLIQNRFFSEKPQSQLKIQTKLTKIFIKFIALDHKFYQLHKFSENDSLKEYFSLCIEQIDARTKGQKNIFKSIDVEKFKNQINEVQKHISKEEISKIFFSENFLSHGNEDKHFEKAFDFFVSSLLSTSLECIFDFPHLLENYNDLVHLDENEKKSQLDFSNRLNEFIKYADKDIQFLCKVKEMHIEKMISFNSFIVEDLGNKICIPFSHRDKVLTNVSMGYEPLIKILTPEISHLFREIQKSGIDQIPLTAKRIKISLYFQNNFSPMFNSIVYNLYGFDSELIAELGNFKGWKKPDKNVFELYFIYCLQYNLSVGNFFNKNFSLIDYFVKPSDINKYLDINLEIKKVFSNSIVEIISSIIPDKIAKNFWTNERNQDTILEFAFSNPVPAQIEEIYKNNNPPDEAIVLAQVINFTVNLLLYYIMDLYINETKSYTYNCLLKENRVIQFSGLGNKTSSDFIINKSERSEKKTKSKLRKIEKSFIENIEENSNFVNRIFSSTRNSSSKIAA